MLELRNRSDVPHVNSFADGAIAIGLVHMQSAAIVEKRSQEMLSRWHTRPAHRR